MDRYKKDIGDNGEELATRFLIKNGYKILERNYNSKFGELDIILQPVGPVIGAHCGPGTIGLIFHCSSK